MIISYFPAGGDEAKFTYAAAAELPATGVDDQLLIITDQTPSEYYLDTSEPESPADNAVWFMIGNVGTVSVDVAEETNFSMTLQSAKIYDANEASWTNCSGYIFQNGAWVQFAVGLPPRDTLENTTWSEIRVVSDLGMAEEYWSLGDEKTVNVNGVDLKVRIIGFNHFETDMYTKEKKGILFEFTQHLEAPYCYDSDGATVTWNNSDIRNELNGTFLTTLPEGLQNTIRECYPPFLNEDFSAIQYVADKVFVLSLEEYNFSTSYIYSKEATITSPVAYYAAGNSGVFQYMDEYDSLITRSKYDNDDNIAHIAFATNDGRAAYGDGDSAFYQVVPAFVV